MSFVDLATLTMHRRHEMESRINIFMEKIGHLESNVNKLKMQARGLVNQLNCEPAELKDRFLDGMKKLDEYIYLATEFNLSFAKLAETSGLEFTPVHDVPNHMATPPHPAHLLDVLSEPVPSTSLTKSPQVPPVTNTTKPKKFRPPKEDVLINFSSASCSQESMPESRHKQEKEVQCGPLVDKMMDMNISGPLSEMLNIPAQVVLQTDIIYHGVITHVDGPALWIISDNVDEARILMHDMRDHYLSTPPVVLSRAQLRSLTYCSYYDQESDCPYRCLFLRELDDSSETAELFLMDTGEIRESPVNAIQPLHRKFFELPPFARCCHLAGVDILGPQNKETTSRLESFLKNYIGEPCDVEVDDNTSESLGVFIQLQSKQYLNQILIDQGLAVPVPQSLPGPAPVSAKAEEPKFGPPEVTSSRIDSDIDILACPEYEDALEAVTGYHNNDERDICKHYKGGPDKTCFKGPRCKKRHVTMHPDGWTLDRVPVPGRLRSATLPSAGAARRARITCVPHLDHVYIQLVTDLLPEPKRRFGEVVPPMTLPALVREMNSAAGRVAHKPLKLAPAPGELVAAIFPPDEQWYRAVVLSLANYDQSVQVRYVDYGNEMWIKENLLRTLDPSYTLLPVQAIRCRLAGVAAKGDDPELWGRAKTALSDLVLEKTMNALIVARHYDELDIELYDENDDPVSDKLAAKGLVLLQEYTIQDDTNVRHKMVIP